MQDEKNLEQRLHDLEYRLETLERWKDEVAGRGEVAFVEPPPSVHPPSAAEQSAPSDSLPSAERGPQPIPEIVQPPPVDFDIALVGRTLIVLGGAFLLRAITESGVVPAAAGVLLGLAYAITWMIVGLRPAVSRSSAAYHGVAAVLAAYPLIFEATRKFDVFEAWSSVLVLVVVSVLWVLLTWRKRLYGLAWLATLGAMGTTVLLMAETSSMVPFVWYTAGLGVTTLWMGYQLRWYALRWPVAAFLDAMLLLMAFLVVTDRLIIEPLLALFTAAVAFTGYLISFVVRNLIRERNVVLFDVAQMMGALVCGLGGALWVAEAKALAVPFALSVLLLAALCYGASFIFIPRHAVSPGSFFFYSTLALVLVLGAAAFITEGLPSSILWSGLALTAAYFAGRYEKPVLAMHCGIYLVAGVIGAGLVQAGFRVLALPAGTDWSVAWESAILILAASAITAGIHPIERKGSFSVWNTAKLGILLVFGWTCSTLLMAALGSALHGTDINAGIVAFERTAILSGLTIAAAWVARYRFLAPGRQAANILMIVLAMKLLWDDLRVGNPATMFLSFACVGTAMILATKLRKGAVEL